MEATAYWAVVLPPKGKPVEQQVESTEAVLTSIHVTGLALGLSPAKGPHAVTLEYNGTNTVLAHLEAPQARMHSLDIAVDQTVKFRNYGDSEVHVYGYQVSMMVRSEDEEDEDEEGEEEEGEEEEEEEEDEDEDEDEEAPQAIPIKQAPNGVKAKARAKGAKMEVDEGGSDDFPSPSSDDLLFEAASEDEDEDEDEDEEGEEEGESEDEGEEEEEEKAPAPAKAGDKRALQTPQPAKAAKQARQAEPPKTAPPKQQQQQKQGSRTIPVTIGGQAEPPAAQGKKAAAQAGPSKKGAPAAAAKKGKQDGTAKPSPAPKGPAAPANEAEYKAAVVAMLQQAKGAPVPLTTLGNAIVRPAGVPKLTAFLGKNKDTFEVDPKKGVTLKKA